ncbi:MAG TPA: sensor histidine kinase [Stellaceae bacterium]|nr:sensor histidine kinase [Stellaceae bacterium]
MSLRWRLIGLVAIALVLSLALAAAMACFNASRSVGIEMRAALLVGVHTVENAVLRLQTSQDPQRDLDNLVALFRGNRHLRVSLTGQAGVVAAPDTEQSPFGNVPRWFVRMVGVPSETVRVPVAVPGRPDAAVLLETDPRNETRDTWNDFNNTLIVLTLFSSSTILLIYLFIGRGLRPLYRLAAALEQVGRGNYATRIGGRLTPELSRLHDSFNRMAGRLAEADADNRRLNEQLLTVQEQERGDIARDLHDEVGPYLFAINIDTAAASRLIEERRAKQAAAHLRLIAEAVGHMQHEIRAIVRRLHPVGLAEFGLRDAVGDLIRFWDRRHPGVAFQLTIAPECTGLGEATETTLYRIVQECLSNAVRHGPPTRIDIDIRRTATEGGARIAVDITDDGPGMPDEPAPGFGLRGMAERVRALGGTLTLRNRPAGGLAVSATLPLHAEKTLAADAVAGDAP